MKKEHQIIMLPSEKPSNIKLGVKVKSITHSPMRYVTDEDFDSDEWNKFGTFQHLYILSDEEIKEGDWYYNELDKAVRKNNTINHSYHKKIIATTDVLALNKGYSTTGGIVPQIPKHIIEAYVKKPFDKVMVEYDFFEGVGKDYGYDSEDMSIQKLNQDGTLAVSLVEEKMYSREYLKPKFIQFYQELKNMTEDKGKMHLTYDDVEQWIKENL